MAHSTSRIAPVSYTHLHVPDATGAAILITKSGISNHAASDIPDHLCFSKFGTFHAVSYTHLDVYKRQVFLALSGLLAAQFLCGCCGLLVHTVDLTIQSAGRVATAVTTVSYTHLKQLFNY